MYATWLNRITAGQSLDCKASESLAAHVSGSPG